MSTFRVDETLLRTVLAAVAFLHADDLPQPVYDQLNNPSDRELEALNTLAGIRMREAP